MLHISITNERQRTEKMHVNGVMYFGRQQQQRDHFLLIDDQHVSRDQLEAEELDGERVRLRNRGNSLAVLRDGTRLEHGDDVEVALPVQLTVGRTVIELSDLATRESLASPPAAAVATFESDSFVDLRTLVMSNVAQFYPFPVAYGHRLLEGLGSAAEVYKEQLRLAENLIAFLAATSLALLEPTALRMLNDKFGGSALSCWQGGISPGHWLSLAGHAAKQLEKQSPEPLTLGLINLQLNSSDKGLGRLLRGLIRAKNDFKHDRGPSIESEYTAASDEVELLLTEALGLVSFLTEHPVVLVEDLPEPEEEDGEVLLLKCMGDHPGFAAQKRVCPPGLRRGELYIQHGPDALTTLFPFLTVGACAQCKTREFFCVDRLDEGKRSDAGTRAVVAGLKSFDRGHSQPSPEIGAELFARFTPEGG